MDMVDVILYDFVLFVWMIKVVNSVFMGCLVKVINLY